ncbi:MAG: hypothetical protein R3C26_02310 [Calditrichia bacterium]
MSQKEIKFKITLDENKMPAQIEWSADDADFEGEKSGSSNDDSSVG